LESGESAVIVADRPEVAVEPGYRGRLALADVVGYRLEAFQRKIARAVLGPERECLILLPRGNAKTTLTALVALHHLLSTEGAKVYFVAASVPQARIAFEAAADFARRLGHDNVVFRHLQLRWCEDPDEPTVFTRHMRVLGAEGPRLHGLSPTLMVLDELQAVTRTDIYPALASALHRAPNSKLVVISTAGSGVDSPLGTLRQRALGLRQVGHRGALTDARGPDLRMLEWAVPADANVSVMACAAACRSVPPAVVDSNCPRQAYCRSPSSRACRAPGRGRRSGRPFRSAIDAATCGLATTARCRTPGVRPRLPRRPRLPHRRPTRPALLLWQG
jgi:Phage Terminase